MSLDAGTVRMSGATILSRALVARGGDVPVETARFLLDLDIRDADKTRALELLAKRQQGEITGDEAEELRAYVEADNMLSILKARALLALKTAGRE